MCREIISILKNDAGFNEFLEIVFNGAKFGYESWGPGVVYVRLGSGDFVYRNLAELNGETAKEKARSFVDQLMRELDM